MPDEFVDKLEALIGEHRQAEQQQQRDEATEARFKNIEDKFDALGNLIDERLPKNSPQQPTSEVSAGNEGEEEPARAAAADPSPPPPDDDDLPLERIHKLQVPRFYNGDDEPENVRYIDADDGETKTRKGRRKGKITTIDVENVEPEMPQPQEPEVVNE